MKTLIENSILVKRTGKGNKVKTIFNSTERESQKWFDISELSGKRASVEYSYTEDSLTKSVSLFISIPESLDESTVKEHVISAITEFLLNPA